MHDGVKPGLAEDKYPGHLVQENVVVEGQNACEPHLSHEGNGIAEHKHQHHDRVKVQAESYGIGS
jgi:hypothetical protein